MAIKKIHFPSFRNDEHFEFMTHFLNLIIRFGAEKLKVAAQFAVFLTCYGQEDEALKKIMKSDFTRKIHEADSLRDEVFRGMVNANRAALTHFKPAVREAAIRMQIVFDTYGNVTQKPVDEETSAIYNLLKELSTNHEADMELVGLNGWYEELHVRNKAVEKLMEDRIREAAERSSLVLRKVRGEVDEAYRVVTMCVETFSIVETGETQAACNEFIRELNILIDRAGNIVAIRRGISAAKKKEEQQKPTKPAEPITN